MFFDHHFKACHFKVCLVVCTLIGVAPVTIASAQISAKLAKQCRAMMVKAHPSVLYGTDGTAAEQREYFSECIRRQGKMDASGSTTGQDKHGPN